mmetsp:Transcript_23547/g.20900  ORF Transcript_23547/g.20900 Transcript_23547/m.20900 type:complete len:146 (+) Transcript_23547:581-1018(+)
MYRNLYRYSSIFGLGIVIAKLVIGVYLLRILKYHLNFYYKQKKNGIILAIFLSFVAAIFKTFYNFSNAFEKLDLKTSFANLESITLLELSYQLAISLFARLIPIFVIALNIKIIYYTCLMSSLMNGCNLGHYLKICSMFMRSKSA